LVVQHPREQRHPIGSLRFARLGLQACTIEVAERQEDGALRAALDFPEGAALLYPDEDAAELAELDEATRPSTLVVLDGTWSTVRRLLAGDPRLRALPRVAITPKRAGNYRIRREPRAECLSTLEALIEALRLLEPERDAQWDGLLAAFDSMIDKQIEIVATRGRPRKARASKVQQFRAVPERFGLEYGPLLVINVESTQVNRIGTPGTRRRRQVVRLSATRLSRDAEPEHFDQIVRIEGRLPVDKQLLFMGLSKDDVLAGCSESELGKRWQAFARPQDRLCAWNQVAMDLVPDLDDEARRERFVLKGIYADLRRRRAGDLAAACAREGLDASHPLEPDAQSPGRALLRLSAALHMVKWLHDQRHPSTS
jgi:DTW domain-containing protein YfiP